MLAARRSELLLRSCGWRNRRQGSPRSQGRSRRYLPVAERRWDRAHERADRVAQIAGIGYRQGREWATEAEVWARGVCTPMRAPPNGTRDGHERAGTRSR